MTKTRLTALLLAILMLAGIFCSCGETVTDTPADETEAVAVAETTIPVTTEEVTTGAEETLLVENLAKDGKATPFNMLVRANRYAYLYTEEADGQPVSNAVYSRNALLEEKYGIKISITEATDSSTGFSTYLASGDSTFDLVCFDYWWNLELKGYFTNLLNCSEIDPEASWWYQGWNDNVTLNNKLYTIVGDANLEILENLEIMFFNKKMAEDRNLDLYTDVKNGNWTVDRLLEVSKMTAANLDDADTANDIYGALYDKHSLRCQLVSAGLKMSEKTSDGLFTIENAGNDNNIQITEKITSLIHDVSVDFSNQNARARDWTLFKNSQAMLYATSLYLGQSLRAANLDFDYGILPVPKLTKDSDYISTPYGVSVFAIPVNASSVHNSAMILNAMNFYSSNNDSSLVPTFYDLVLKYQIADCVQDVENLDLIREKVFVDFAFIYDVGVFSIFHTAVTNNTSVSSSLRSSLKVSKKQLETNVYKYYQEN